MNLLGANNLENADESLFEPTYKQKWRREMSFDSNETSFDIYDPEYSSENESFEHIKV